MKVAYLIEGVSTKKEKLNCIHRADEPVFNISLQTNHHKFLYQ